MRTASVGLLAVVLVVMMSAIAVPVAAHDYDRDNDGHILRIVAHVLHPIGMGLEYGIMRPIHQLVSLPGWRFILGHDPRNERDELGQYPTCAQCRPAQAGVECPTCHEPRLKPRDQYWGWR